MQRPLPEVLASQDQMLRRRGTYIEATNPAAIAAAFEKHLKEVYAWLASRSNVRVVRIPYHGVMGAACRNQPQTFRFPGDFLEH